MSFEFLSHTADIRMRVRARTLAELFREAAEGMFEFLNAKIKMQNAKLRKISISSQDVTSLLIDFLNELLAFAQIHKEAYDVFKFTTFTPTSLQAEVEGMQLEEFSEDIKAVTYHEAEVRQNEKGEWETIVIFDI